MADSTPVDRLALGPHGRDLAGTALALAAGFAQGATLWCTAPAWPAHAHHVAVEFVHPVVVGARALPAVALDGQQLLHDLRVQSTPGDVLLAVAPGHQPDVTAAMRRAPAFGLSTVWIGAGVPPPPGTADHVLFVDGDDTAAFDGRLVLLYHVLWELTHVCFEHPGLLRPVDGPGPTCITCGDEGRLAEVVSVAANHTAVLRSARGQEQADVALVAEARPGDLVLVHGGCVVTVVEAGSR